MIERLPYYGVYIVESLDIITGNRARFEIKNAITQGFFSAVHHFLNQSTSTPEPDALNVTHIAVGEGDTPATRNDYKLVDEIYRKDLASRSFTTVLFTAKISLDSGEGNPVGGFIKELGVYARGTETKDSGLLLSRTAANVQKNSNIQLVITWELRQQ